MLLVDNDTGIRLLRRTGSDNRISLTTPGPNLRSSLS
jgi:hypothetical protein